MSLAINHNITALNAWRNLKNTDMNMGRSMEKLSSGLRINRASDDPAGLVISEKMRAQLVGLSAATKNVEKAVNMVSTAEASLDKVHQLLDKMRSLAIDSANLGVNDDAMLKANQDELDEAIDSITRIAKFTQFGTKKLLDGSLDSNYSAYSTFSKVTNTDAVKAAVSVGITSQFQVGANENQIVTVDIGSVLSYDIGRVTAGSTFASMDASGNAVGVIYDDARGISAAGTLFSFKSGAGDNTRGADFTLGSTGYTTVNTGDVDFISIENLRSSLTATDTRLGITTTFQRGVFAFTAGTTISGYTSSTGTNSDGSVNKADAIAQAIAVIDVAIEQVSSIRGKLGAVQADNLEVQLDALRVSYENLQAAESTIRDTDMTAEMAEFTKLQIMMQAGTAMLAQANQMPNNVLQLLR